MTVPMPASLVIGFTAAKDMPCLPRQTVDRSTSGVWCEESRWRWVLDEATAALHEVQNRLAQAKISCEEVKSGKGL